MIEHDESNVNVALEFWMAMPQLFDELTSRSVMAMVPVTPSKSTPLPLPELLVPTSSMVAPATPVPVIARPLVAAMSRPRTVLPLASSMTSPAASPMVGTVAESATSAPPPA